MGAESPNPRPCLPCLPSGLQFKGSYMHELVCTATPQIMPLLTDLSHRAHVLGNRNAAVPRGQAPFGHQLQVGGLAYGDGQVAGAAGAGKAVRTAVLGSTQAPVVRNLPATLPLLLLLGVACRMSQAIIF